MNKMKKNNFIKGMLVFALCFAFCSTGKAQDWKSILSGVANAITEGKGSDLASWSIEGTWNYTGPDCKFTSDNLLAKAGGEVASKKVEEKMTGILEKLGFTEGCSYTFNSDGTYTSTVKGRTTSGTYTYDSETKELQLKTKLELKFNAIVSQNVLAPKKMSLLFKADKVMSLMQTIGSALSSNSSNSVVSTANSLLDEYDGLQLGFALEKQ